MTTHLSLQRMLLPTAQVSSLTTGSITLPGARTAFVDYQDQPLVLLGSYKTVGAYVTGFSVSNIPQTYRSLYIRGTAQIATGVTANNFSSNTLMRFNGDTSNNYGYAEYYFWQGGTDGAAAGDNQTRLTNLYVAGNGDGRNNYTTFEIFLPNYRDTSNYKNVIFNGGFIIDASTVSRSAINNYAAAEYRSLSPITSFSLTNTGEQLRENSAIWVYGYGDGS